MGSKLVTMGWTESFVLRIQRITSQFRCQAAVVQGLSEDMNMGSGFLQRVSTVGMGTQLHCYLDGVSLQIQNEVMRLEGRKTMERIRPVVWQEREITQLDVRPNRKETEPVETEERDPTRGDRDVEMDTQPNDQMSDQGNIESLQPVQNLLDRSPELVQAEPEKGE